MFVGTYLFILLLSLCLLTYHRFKQKYKNIDKLPGPPAKWFVGNLAEFGTNSYDLFQNCQRIIRTYGKIVRIWQGPHRINLFITDLNLVEYFLSSNEHIHKSAGYSIFNSFVGDGLITASGEMWKKHRKILTPAFHFKILEQFSTNFHANAQILINILKKESGQTVDLKRYMKNYALDVLCEATMGMNFHSQQDPNIAYPVLIEKIMDIFIRRFFSVLNRSDFIFSLSSEYKYFQKLLKEIHAITRKVINMRRSEMQGKTPVDAKDDFGIKSKKVFMDLLLEYPGISDEEVEWQANSFLFAGHDTVGTCLSFAIYLLSKHPESQQKIFTEIKEVLGGDRNEIVTVSHLKQMSYLDRVVKECLRIYPSSTIFERELMVDVNIDGLEIPKGTTLSFHPFSQHRDPDVFPNPEVFDPDRFLPENVLSRHPFAYIPFSAGPRNCIGQKYAVIIVKTVLINVIRNFDILRPDFEHTPILGSDPVLKSKNGLPIKLIYRD